METQSFTIRNHLDQVEPVQDQIKYLLQARGVRLKQIQEVLLALGEWLENVILHAYPDTGEHLITVDFFADDAEVRLCISDDGPSCNLNETPAPDHPLPPGQRAVTGPGIRLIRSLMDYVEYQRRDGRNFVVLVKQVIPSM